MCLKTIVCISSLLLCVKIVSVGFSYPGKKDNKEENNEAHDGLGGGKPVSKAESTHSSVKEPFSPGRAAEGGRPSLAPGEEWLLRISPPQNGGIGGTMAL